MRFHIYHPYTHDNVERSMLGSLFAATPLALFVRSLRHDGKPLVTEDRDIDEACQAA